MLLGNVATASPATKKGIRGKYGYSNALTLNGLPLNTHYVDLPLEGIDESNANNDGKAIDNYDKAISTI